MRPPESTLSRDDAWLEELVTRAAVAQQALSETNVELALLNQTVSPAQLGEAAARKELKRDIEAAEEEKAQQERRLEELRTKRDELAQRIERHKLASRARTEACNPLEAEGLLERIEGGEHDAISSCVSFGRIMNVHNLTWCSRRVSDAATIREMAESINRWTPCVLSHVECTLMPLLYP